MSPFSTQMLRLQCSSLMAFYATAWMNTNIWWRACLSTYLYFLKYFAGDVDWACCFVWIYIFNKFVNTFSVYYEFIHYRMCARTSVWYLWGESRYKLYLEFSLSQKDLCKLSTESGKRHIRFFSNSLLSFRVVNLEEK